MINTEIIDFLLGSHSIDGYSYGDKPMDRRPEFWWRDRLLKLKDEISSLNKEQKHDEGNQNLTFPFGYHIDIIPNQMFQDGKMILIMSPNDFEIYRKSHEK